MIKVITNSSQLGLGHITTNRKEGFLTLTGLQGHQFLQIVCEGARIKEKTMFSFCFTLRLTIQQKIWCVVCAYSSRWRVV